MAAAGARVTAARKRLRQRCRPRPAGLPHSSLTDVISARISAHIARVHIYRLHLGHISAISRLYLRRELDRIEALALDLRADLESQPLCRRQ